MSLVSAPKIESKQRDWFMEFSMAWGQTRWQNSWAAVQMKLQKEFKTSRNRFLELPPGFRRQLHLAKRKGEENTVLMLAFLHWCHLVYDTSE